MDKYILEGALGLGRGLDSPASPALLAQTHRRIPTDPSFMDKQTRCAVFQSQASVGMKLNEMQHLADSSDNTV